MIRIANGSACWGDWLEAPVRLIEQGPIDYLTLNYGRGAGTALEPQQADPELGYACEFPPLMARMARQIRERGVRVAAAAGGANAVACAREIRRLAPSLSVSAVVGGNILGRLDALLADGHELRNLDTGEPLAAIRSRVLSADIIESAFPLAEALGTGAGVAIAGCADNTSLALAAAIHHFGWKPEDYSLLAAGAAAGHLIGGGAQLTAGGDQSDCESIPDPAHIGYPIAEMEPDGCFTVTKHKAAGGRVQMDLVKERLLSETGDPRWFFTPDCSADFTALRMESAGADRVRICGSRGGPPPGDWRVLIRYRYGWKAVGTLVCCWPRAVEKARAADAVLRERLRDLDLELEAVHSELAGVNACHQHLARPAADPPEVLLRIGVRARDRGAVERFARELTPLALCGLPGLAGLADGYPRVREITAPWYALLPRREAPLHVEVIE